MEAIGIVLNVKNEPLQLFEVVNQTYKDLVRKIYKKVIDEFNAVMMVNEGLDLEFHPEMISLSTRIINYPDMLSWGVPNVVFYLGKLESFIDEIKYFCFDSKIENLKGNIESIRTALYLEYGKSAYAYH